MNLLAFGTDSYKQSHYDLYPEDVRTVYSYCESRVGGMFDTVTFFGLQYIISKYLTGQVVTREAIEEADQIVSAHIGPGVFNRKGWEYILENHDGYLPIRIEALREGTNVNSGVCLFTIQNTGGQPTAWLTNFIETLLMHVWSPCTVATSSMHLNRIVNEYLEESGDPAGLGFKVHDFGMRGVSSMETASLAGAAHLLYFMGSDTMAAIPLLRDYYGAEEMSCFSIPATEHSVMTAGGPDGEADIVRRVLRRYPTGLVAIVIDSFDTMNFIRNVIGGNEDIMEMIRNREGTVVFRPDSGELPQIDIDVFNALEDVFGSTVNEKGFRVLPPYVRMIQGDGVAWYETLDTTYVGTGSVPYVSGYRHTIQDILDAFLREGISADNIAFGSGGGLLQKWDRDTLRFAIKCCAMETDEGWRDIFKQPKTDPTKNSLRGRRAVIDTCSGPQNIRFEELGEQENLLRVVFENGKQYNLQNFNDLR